MLVFCVCYLPMRPRETSCDSPCACGIIHEAVTLRYASIKHHLQPTRARIVSERWENERREGTYRQETRDREWERETNAGCRGCGYSNRWWKERWELQIKWTVKCGCWVKDEGMTLFACILHISMWGNRVCVCVCVLEDACILMQLLISVHWWPAERSSLLCGLVVLATDEPHQQ